MQNIEVWIFGALAVILAAEIVAGRHRGIYSRNDYIVNGVCFVAGFMIRPAVMIVSAAAIAFLLPHEKATLHGVSFWQTVVVIVLLAEFGNYWVHRLSHQLKGKPFGDWLWRLHRTHHTGKYVNVLLHFRINMFWAFVTPLTWITAAAIYLGQGEAALVAVLIFSLWGIVTHSHFRWDDPVRRHRVFGPAFRALEHVIISPGVHHSHHGFGRDGGNYRNYGIFLAIFDWMFGTLYIPQGRPSRYGIPDPTPYWAEEVFYPLYQADAKNSVSEKPAQ